jgi:ketosteroid isomerase-like protein
MTTAELAAAFTAMLKGGDHRGAAARFNSPDIVSIEAMEGPMARIQGTEALKAEWDWWYGNHAVHDVTVEGPFVNGDGFILIFGMDFTPKATGERMQSRETALYTVGDGKIVEERFFY